MRKFLANAGVLAMTALPSIALAQVGPGPDASTFGLTTSDLQDTLISIVNAVLAFLFIIALIIILWGGFRWMTAAGNEDTVGEAKKIIAAGIIGLIIVLLAYAIVNFVISTVAP